VPKSSGKVVGLDLENLKIAIKSEIRKLDQRRDKLLQNMVHLKTLESLSSGEDLSQSTPESSTPPAQLAESPPHPPEPSSTEEMLAAVRCLKCGSSLRMLIPTNSKGEPNFGSPQLGRSEGGGRYLECPQCHARNEVVRTTSPHGWKLLITQLRQ
jgi:hypothetical protein